ncbi:MAG: DUF4157 domain-containing protein [Phormidesmis sp.]
METAQARKAEDTAKTTHAAPDVALKSETKADGGAAMGMPMFLQRSSTDTTMPIQRQTEAAEETLDMEEETLAKETLEEAALEEAALEEADIQAELIVNEPGDAYEQEADQMAEAVTTSLPEDPLETSSPRDDQIQRQSIAATAAPSISGLATADSGQPIPRHVRAQIEPTLGTDLTDVRVHSQPADRKMASSLQAKAFTHNHHIWLGENQNADDVRLMAHESTHVVQQATGDQSVQRIQRKSTGSQHPEDIAEPRRRMAQRIEDAEKEAQENPPEDAPASFNDIDRSEVNQQKGKASSDAALVVNRPEQERPQIEQVGSEAQSDAEAPAEPVVETESAAAEGAIAEEEGNGEAGGTAEANQAAGLAEQLFNQADAQTVEISLPSTTLLQPSAPVDASGQSLPANPTADAQMAGLIDQTQLLRDQGQALRQGAAEQRGNAITIRGNIKLAQGSMHEVDANLENVRGDLDYRRDVLGQANESLNISEKKTETVAEQAPEYQSKADEGKADSEPMATEVNDLSAETTANTPDDDEAAGKAKEQGQKVDQVSSDTQTTDDAFAQSQARAESLGQDSEEAKATNEQTQEKLTTVDSTLAATDDQLAAFSAQNAATQSHFEGLSKQPDQLISQADTLDQGGQDLIQASVDLETQIHQTQVDYETSMSAVPASTVPDEAEGGPPTIIQRTPESPGERVNLGLDEWAQNTLGGWLGYDPVNEEQRQQQYAASEARRSAQIQEITNEYGENLENADALDKVLIGISLAGSNLFNSAAEASWPSFFGHLLQGFVDPRIGLQGVVSGLNMVLSGIANVANLLTGEDLTWENAIKSTAEIVTGITYILGGITLVATAITVILTAIAVIGSLFSFGAVAAALAPFISFFWGVATTVGGWTILWAKITILAQLIAGLKDLMDAAVASSAQELQGQAQQMSDDATQMAGAAAIVGLAKLGAVGGRTALGQRAANGIRGFLGDRGIIPPAKVAPPQELAPVEPTAPRSAEPAPVKPTTPRPTEPTPVEPGVAKPTEPTPVEPSAPKLTEPVEPTPAEPTEPKPTEPRPAEPTEPKLEEPAAPKPKEPTPTEKPVVPKPTPEESIQIDKYVKALEQLKTANEAKNVADADTARQVMDEVENFALEQHGRGGPYNDLVDHIDTLTKTRSLLEAAHSRGNQVYPIEEPPGSGNYIEGMGRQFTTESAQAGPFKGKTYTQIEAELGIPKSIEGTPPGRVRITWQLGDNSFIHVDVPGTTNTSPYAINRQPHLARTAQVPYQELHLSDQGIGVPANSTPAHIEIRRDALLQQRINSGGGSSGGE